jgi:hypothetical protein
VGGVGVVGAAAQELGEGAEAGVDGEAGDAVDEGVGGELSRRARRPGRRR